MPNFSTLNTAFVDTSEETDFTVPATEYDIQQWSDEEFNRLPQDRELLWLRDVCAQANHDLQSLEWFTRVNVEAMDRIFTKLHRVGITDSNPTKDRLVLQWTKTREDVQANILERRGKLRSLFDKVLKAGLPEPESASLNRCVRLRDPLPFMVVSAGVAKRSKSQSAPDVYAMVLEHMDRERALLPLSRAELFRNRLKAVEFAARSGLDGICRVIIDGLLVELETIKADPDEFSRFSCTMRQVLCSVVAENNTSTALYILGVLEGPVFRHDLKQTMGKRLRIAIKNQNDDIIRALLKSKSKPRLTSETPRTTCLHAAAEVGRFDHTVLVLDAFCVRKIDFDTPDESRGWTPLFYAFSNGHYDVARLLLEAGSNEQYVDPSGWTAKEHAVFKGHLALADLFTASGTSDLGTGPAQIPRSVSTSPRLCCRKDESVIIASLGSTQKHNHRHTASAIHIDYSHPADADPSHNTDHEYYLNVHAPGSGSCSARRLRLPVLDDKINDPFIFAVPNTTSPRLKFDIRCPNVAEPGEDILVASGTALLDGNIRQFGTNRQSLIREHTVTLLDRKTMEMAGTITFTYMVATPFPHAQPELPLPINLTLGFGEPPTLIGHRGLGMNFPSRTHLQIGENTIESFLSAAKLGAEFVEFDIQLTRDLQPVVFHDFSLSESGTDIPIHDVTLEQYHYTSTIQSPHGNPLSVLGKANTHATANGRVRSRSLGNQFEEGAVQVHDRMKHTVDYNLKGFKPNTRGEIIQDSFATLKDILLGLPEEIGLDVEVKYPRLHEARAAGVAPVAIELNTFVDVILETIYKYSKPNRKIIVSSFTPEICILLSLKQKNFPVFFITNAGKVPMVDMEVRAASVQVAVKFARKWNLVGVVFSCEALMLCPRLVGFVKGRGLVCASYGVLNNEPEKVEVCF